MFYKMFKVIVKGVFHLFFRIEIKGAENIPISGGAIVAINHRSNWDAPVVWLAGKRKLRFMAKAELFKLKLGNWFFKSIGAFPVNRGTGDIGAIKAALKMLKEGHIIAMFPEGTRVRKGMVSEPKPGVLLLATRAKVPVIPVHISGGYRWLSRVSVTIGEPVSYDKFYETKLSVGDLQEMSNELMRIIMSL